MSVINNVLKDLETRESHFTPIDIGAVGQEATPARDLKPLLLIAVLVLVAIAAGWAVLQNQLPGNAELPPPPMFENLPVTSIVPAVSEPQVEPELAAGVVTEQMVGNQIIGLQLRETDADMRMEFELRDKVVAYLKERGENSFGYHLRDVESQIVAPVISSNTWIRALSIVSTEGGVDVNFETADDILVETRQNLVGGEPVWAISLRKAVQPGVAASPVTVTARSEIAAIKPAAQEPAESPAPLDEVVAATPTKAKVAASPTEVRLDIRSTNPDAKSANELEYAVELIKSRRLVDAEALLQGLLTGVEDYDARKHLLALYSRQKRNNRFLRLVRESMTAYPNDALFRTEYARVLFQSAAYRSVIQLFADDELLDARQHALIAASYQRLDEHENAISFYRLALETDSGNARNWIGLGISQEHSSALEQALDSYQQAAGLGGLSERLRAFVDKRSQTLRQVLN
jgi:MSHA biogenesis protein MshN